MFKKLILFFIFIFGLFSFQNSYSACPDKENIICANYEFPVNALTPGMNTREDKSIEENVNFVLGTIIQKLMIGLGSVALLMMTVGTGYIILHSGQDELLSKGKSIVMSGIYALVLALGSYYLISIVRYILYN